MYADLTGRPRWYVLDGQTPRVVTVDAWAAWFAHHAHEAVVAVDTVGAVTLITRFTGMDRALQERGAPILFETEATVQNAPLKPVSVACAATWAEASERHRACVRSLQSAIEPHNAMNQAWLTRTWRTLCRAVSHGAAFFV